MNRTFDRLPSFDQRSRNFSATLALPDKPQRSYTWGVPVRLDQGAIGQCVGFGFGQELAARPKVHTKVTYDTARQIYLRAQQLDEWPGEDYEGTSILAGAKTVQEKNYVTAYHWCFTLSELVLAVGYLGPVVLGVNWHTGQMDTDSNGFIHPTGAVEGGHAIIANGVSVKSRSFLLTNSWGAGWGTNGQCRITWSDMWQLLSEQGEACVPIGRRWVTDLR
jgi:papain like protease